MTMYFLQGRVSLKPLTKNLTLSNGYIFSSEIEGLYLGDFIFADQYILGILNNIICKVATYVPAASISNLL